MSRSRRRSGHRGPPDILYHATTQGRAEKALEDGFVRGRRGGVVLSDSESQAWMVAHRGSSDPEVLYVDSSRVRQAGVRLKRVGRGLWRVPELEVRFALNLRQGFGHQYSAGGIPIWFGPEGPELALIRVRRGRRSTWEVAKGKMEPGETPLETGIREVCEEMGVNGPMEAVRQLSTIRYGFTIPGGAPRLKTVYMFLLRTSVRWDVFELADNEGVVDAGWFTPEAAANLVRHRSLVPIVMSLRDDLAVSAPLSRSGERLSGTEDPPARIESESRD